MIICIPCWRRPAHLAALLETIQRARGAMQHYYVVSVDHDPAPEIGDVLQTWSLRSRLALTKFQGEHVGQGPAWNVLQAWLMGWLVAREFSHAAEPIGLLEEDLVVSTDLFEFWADALELDPTAIGVSACLNQNKPTLGQFAHTPWRVYADVSYQSLAVALKPDLVEEVLTHANAAYFADPASYVAEHLPDPGLPASAISQDGLFHRVIRRRQQPLLYPTVERASHVGWYGYNRREGLQLDPVNWREDTWKILHMPADHMNELADPRFRDITRGALIRERSRLKLF